METPSPIGRTGDATDRQLPYSFITQNKADLIPVFAPVRIDRDLLRSHGYGEAAMETLEAGVSISYSKPDTPKDHSILEYPDGRRFLKRGHWLPDRKAWFVQMIIELPRAPR